MLDVNRMGLTYTAIVGIMIFKEAYIYIYYSSATLLCVKTRLKLSEDGVCSSSPIGSKEEVSQLRGFQADVNATVNCLPVTITYFRTTINFCNKTAIDDSQINICRKPAYKLYLLTALRKVISVQNE